VRSAAPFNAYSVTSAPVSGWLIRIVRPVYCSDPMPFRTSPPRTSRLAAPRKREAAQPHARGPEQLNPLTAGRRIRHDERVAARLQIKGARLDDPPLLVADLDDLPGCGLLHVDEEDGVGAAVEDVRLAGRSALEVDRVQEHPGQMRRDAAHGVQDAGLHREERRQKQEERKRKKKKTESAGQYRATSVIARRTSAVCGRISSSRSG